MKKSAIITLVIGSIITLGWGILSVYLGAQNNNQGEFYNFELGPGNIHGWDITYTLQCLFYPFLAWLILFFVVWGIVKIVKMVVR